LDGATLCQLYDSVCTRLANNANAVNTQLLAVSIPINEEHNQRCHILGEAGANRSMGKLEKIGDEPGE
jgi:hypothetical protein